MANQVNLTGGLTPGANQTLSSAPVPQRPAPTPAPQVPPAVPGETGSSRPEGEASKASPEQIKQAAHKVAAAINGSPSDVKFMVDDSTGQYYFKIVDAVTHRTIRQVPSEEVLSMAQRLQELSSGSTGFIVDAKG